ncbi:hypothetical protein L9F63_025716, partial [Diploptera punctata]
VVGISISLMIFTSLALQTHVEAFSICFMEFTFCCIDLHLIKLLLINCQFLPFVVYLLIVFVFDLLF